MKKIPVNVTAFFGFTLVGATLWFGVFKGLTNASIFLDSHALILVCGGTLAAALLAYPARSLARIADLILLALLFRMKPSAQQVVQELSDLTRAALRRDESCKGTSLSHPFADEAVQLLLTRDLPAEQALTILQNRIIGVRKTYQSEAKMLNAIAKFPPAFGLLGASTGMIAMMLNLGTGGTEAIGPAMAIALVATFWGIGLANLVILPLADFATRSAADDLHVRGIILEWARLVYKGHEPFTITQSINGHLPILDRKNRRPHVDTGNANVEETEVSWKKIS
jgi:chemotaxis protein MotA